MPPKAILFDLDNTLTHRELSIERYTESFLREFGAQVDDSKTVCRLINQVHKGGYLPAGSEYFSIRQAVGSVLADELAWSVAPTPQTLSDIG